MLVVFHLVQVFFVFAVAVVLLLSMRSDFLTMTIPNRYSGAVVVLFLPVWLIDVGLGLSGHAPFLGPVAGHLWAFGGMLLLSIPMFYLGIWGGGDAKLAAGIGLWVGLKGLSVFLGVMAVSGVALVIAHYGLKMVQKRCPAAKFPEGSWPDRVGKGERVLPYGIALSLGGLAAIAALGYFNLFSAI